MPSVLKGAARSPAPGVPAPEASRSRDSHRAAWPPLLVAAASLAGGRSSARPAWPPPVACSRCPRTCYQAGHPASAPVVARPRRRNRRSRMRWQWWRRWHCRSGQPGNLNPTTECNLGLSATDDRTQTGRWHVPHPRRMVEAPVGRIREQRGGFPLDKFAGGAAQPALVRVRRSSGCWSTCGMLRRRGRPGCPKTCWQPRCGQRFTRSAR